jgi:2,5-diketo-D-gluconate reductase A
MDRLGLESLDLYLIHWLQPKQGKYVETWKAFIELQKQGRIKSIGVSNFTVDTLQELIDATGVTPAINQVETHPYFNQQELRTFEEANGILHQSYSPLGSGRGLLDDPVLQDIAKRRNATAAQVVLAWHLALGMVVIPKSVTLSRIEENWASLDLTLEDEDIQAINALDKGKAGRFGADPTIADFR